MMFGVQAPPMKAMQSESGHIGCGVRFLRRFSVIAGLGGRLPGGYSILPVTASYRVTIGYLMR